MSEVTVETGGGMISTFSTGDLNRIINILGKRDIRMFLPLFESDPADNEAVQDLGPRGHHFLKHTTSDNDPYIRGQPLAYRFNGVDEAIDMADNDDFSMGADGTAPNEPAFSVGLAVKFNDATENILLARFDETNAAEAVEWRFRTENTDKLVMQIYDDDNGVTIGQLQDGTVVEDVWYIIVATYDASRVAAGVTLYVDGVVEASTAAIAGAYVAMNNEAVVTSVGYDESAAGVLVDFLDGDLWGPFLTARELSAEDVLKLTNVYRRVLGL